jgi:YhcH/YjgK/YiaL family protein
MLCGKLDVLDTYTGVLAHPVWVEALNWLRAMPPGIVPGIHRLRGGSMYANVRGYDTKPREACRYESHRRYIDFQYCISGGECIEWQPLPDLAPKDEYDETKDVVHFYAPEQPAAILRMTPGSFALFFPCDGHMPKVSDGTNSHVNKLVIKIDRTLLI